MFNDRLKECRELMGLNQVDFADKIGLSKDLYNKYERGNNRPNFETLAKIAEVLNVTTDYLLGITDYKNINDQALVKSSTLDSAFENLSFSSRENIIEITKKLITCMKDFENIQSKKYINFDAGAGNYLLKSIGITINAYQAAADYLCQNKKISDTIYKLNEMLRDADQSLSFIENLAREAESDNKITNEIIDNVIYLRHALQPVSAGTGAYLTEECMEKIRVKFDMQTARADFCVTVSGDSMEPKFHDGDILLVHEQPDIEYGEYGIFIINNEGFVKKRGNDEIISVNHEYSNIPFKPGDNILCSGKVIGILNINSMV